MNGTEILNYVVDYWHVLALFVAFVASIAEARTKLHFLQRRIDQTDEDMKQLQRTIKVDINDIGKKIDHNHNIVIQHLIRGRD